MSNGYQWNFFRAGGFDQVKLQSGADLANLDKLDQKLWVALACPTRGLEFDSRTLDLIDTDHDGRIRAPDIIAAAKWATSCLKNPDDLLKSSPALPLSAINDGTPEGAQLLASAKQILSDLGSRDATEISLAETADTARIFSQTNFNGDGIIPADAAGDDAAKAVINDVIACLGAETDRSGKPGIGQARLDQFFAEAQAHAAWWQQAEGNANVLPLGEATPGAAAALKAVRAKVDDYFARCRLAAYDARALSALNRQEAEYLTVAAQDLSLTASELAGFPIARVEPGRSLPLAGLVNPAWANALQVFQQQVIKPVLGEKTELTERDWLRILTTFTPYEVWTGGKTGVTVEKLGVKRVREILAGQTKETITALIARDKKLEPEFNSIAAVDRLVRYHRDLYQLLNNFVAFRNFFSRRAWAVFQAGTLYLDQRSCDLCIRVDDVAKHSAMAVHSRMYLAYCDCVRKATGEKITIAAAFMGGDSDYLMVGRNGVFYDRQGRDWDATITKIVDNPISIPQAIWSPYKKFLKLVEAQIEKFAASKEKAVQDSAATNVDLTAKTIGTPQAATAKKDAFDVAKFAGIFAAIGLAIGAIGGAMGAMLGAFSRLAWWQMPLAILGIMVLISGPSVIIAWLKLRQRNLGPALDANGWAVNAKAKINLPFGASLTGVARLPAGAKRDLIDPFAESHKGRNRSVALLVVLIGLVLAWYFGLVERYLPGVWPKSGWVLRREQASAPAPAPPVEAPVAAPVK